MNNNIKSLISGIIIGINACSACLAEAFFTHKESSRLEYILDLLQAKAFTLPKEQVKIDWLLKEFEEQCKENNISDVTQRKVENDEKVYDWQNAPFYYLGKKTTILKEIEYIRDVCVGKPQENDVKILSIVLSICQGEYKEEDKKQFSGLIANEALLSEHCFRIIRMYFYSASNRGDKDPLSSLSKIIEPVNVIKIIKAKGIYNGTLLHYAMSTGYDDIILALLNFIDKNFSQEEIFDFMKIKDDKGMSNTPLFWGIMKCKKSVLSILLKLIQEKLSKEQIFELMQIQCFGGMTSLHCGMYKSQEILSVLLGFIQENFSKEQIFELMQIKDGAGNTPFAIGVMTKKENLNILLVFIKKLNLLPKKVVKIMNCGGILDRAIEKCEIDVLLMLFYTFPNIFTDEQLKKLKIIHRVIEEKSDKDLINLLEFICENLSQEKAFGIMINKIFKEDDVWDNMGNLPLHSVIAKGDKCRLSILLNFTQKEFTKEQIFNLMIKQNNSGRILLHLALEGVNKTIMRVERPDTLLRRCYELESEGMEIVEPSCRWGTGNVANQVNVLVTLLAFIRENFSQKQIFDLMQIRTNGGISSLRIAEEDPKHNSILLLLDIVKTFSPEEIIELINKDGDFDENTPLCYAIEQAKEGNIWILTEIFKTLLQKAENIEKIRIKENGGYCPVLTWDLKSKEQTPVLDAVLIVLPTEEVMKVLKIQDDSGNTPFQRAVLERNINFVKKLLDYIVRKELSTEQTLEIINIKNYDEIKEILYAEDAKGLNILDESQIQNILKHLQECFEKKVISD